MLLPMLYMWNVGREWQLLWLFMAPADGMTARLVPLLSPMFRALPDAP